MSDNNIGINSDEINVEIIMDKIREKIRKQQAAGGLIPDPNSVSDSASDICPGWELDDEVRRDLSYMNLNWDIHNNSDFISSHRPYIGKFLVKGRQIAHGEVRRYTDPIISRQTEFNASTVRMIIRASQQCADLYKRQQDLETAFSSFDEKSEKRIVDCVASAKNELESKLEEQHENLGFNIHELESKLEEQHKNLGLNIHELDDGIEARVRNCIEEYHKEFIARMDMDIHSRAMLAHVLEDRVQKELAKESPSLLVPLARTSNYFLFEERFRGSREDIRQRQLVFLQYFEKCSHVLDIGCGRGEFLEILRDHNIGGTGVDSDPDMVTYCRSKHLDVEHADALAYLVTLKDESLDGIFIDQVVEHLEPDYLLRLLAVCYRKMKSGYHIVVETVNPLSFISYVNFYIDLTHKRPVHPETLQYLISATGFREYEKIFLSPVSEDKRLQKVVEIAEMSSVERKNVEVYNHNVDRLNTLLFGAQDYAVVGKK